MTRRFDQLTAAAHTIALFTRVFQPSAILSTPGLCDAIRASASYKPPGEPKARPMTQELTQVFDAAAAKLNAFHNGRKREDYKPDGGDSCFCDFFICPECDGTVYQPSSTLQEFPRFCSTCGTEITQ